MKLSRTAVALLAIQLGIVSIPAARYLYQRWAYPRVWTRAFAYASQSAMRGRYLPLTLRVNGCGHMPPFGPSVVLDKNFAQGSEDQLIDLYPSPYRADLAIGSNTLTATWPPREDKAGVEVVVDHSQSGRCDALLLVQPVSLYVSDHVTDLTRFNPNQELWIEVTVPPKGPPRPIQLALKDNGVWKLLAFQ